MFHVELRQESHRLARLNLSKGELIATLLAPWARGEEVHLGERTWSPGVAEITILEGPEVPIGGMTIGRGWPTAARKGRDVTDAMIAEARSEAKGAASGAGASPPGASGADPALLADSLGLELLRLLADGEMSLRSAWRVAAERNPQLPPSGSLEIAAKAVSSLARSSLVAVVSGGPEGREAVDLADLDAKLADVDSWSEGDSSGELAIRRA